MMELFCKNIERLKVVNLSQKCSTIDFWLRSKYVLDIIAQSLFRAHLNIHDGAFLQK